jgi:hypothetical protein
MHATISKNKGSREHISCNLGSISLVLRDGNMLYEEYSQLFLTMSYMIRFFHEGKRTGTISQLKNQEIC